MQHATMSQSGWVAPFPCPPLTTMRCAVACEAFVRPGSSWILSQCWAGGGSQLNLHRWGRLADRVSNGGKNLLESRFIYSCSKPLYESKFGIWTAFVWNFKPIDLFLLRTQSAASISDLTPHPESPFGQTNPLPSFDISKQKSILISHIPWIQFGESPLSERQDPERHQNMSLIRRSPRRRWIRVLHPRNRQWEIIWSNPVDIMN